MILEGLAERYSLHIKTEIPEAFFRLYLGDRFQLHRQQVDAGCVQKDFIDIEVDECFRRLAAFQAAKPEWLEAEKRWLAEAQIQLVLSDCSSLPLQAARALGLPSIVISNFTWHDIYAHFPGASKNQPLLDALAGEYAQATLQLLPQCHTNGAAVPHRREIGFIAQTGVNRRPALEDDWPEAVKDKTLVFIYLGEAGSARINWPRLAALGDAVFVTRDPVSAAVPNLLVLDERYRYPDLIASADVVLTKAGYSTLATAFAHGKPVLSCARRHFREFDFIGPYLEEHGLGKIIADDRFFACDWEEDIARVRELSVRGRVPLGGEQEVWSDIENRLA